MQLSSEGENNGQQTPEAPWGEFVYLPLSQIAIEKQIRSMIDTASSQAASALVEITGKSISPLRRQLSLLKLHEEIQQALRSGAVGVSQGYLLTAELDNPGLMEVFKALMERPAGNEELKRRLSRARKEAGGNIPTVKADTAAKYRRSLKGIRVSVQMRKSALTTSQADQILTDLRELVALIERLRAEAALAAAPVAPPEAAPAETT